MAFTPLDKPEATSKKGGFVPLAGDISSPPPGPLDGTNMLDRFMIGVGSGMTDIGQGVSQLFGADNLNAIQEKQRIDQQGGLSDSGMGAAGNITGKIALATPAMFIPGANSAVGASIIGGGVGLMEPVADESIIEGKTKNAALGSLLGLGGHQVGKHATNYLSNKLSSRASSNSLLETANSVKDQTLKQAQKLGYRVNPTQANPTITNQLLEGTAGKLSTAQKVAEHNQQVTNSIARRSLGMAEDTPITREALAAIRDQHGQAYKAISGIKQRMKADDTFLSELDDISRNTKEMLADFPDFQTADSQITKLIDSILVDDFNPRSAVEIVKRLRDDSATHFRSMDDPAKRALAFAEKKAANALDSLIGRNLKGMGKDHLHQNWHTARREIAKSYTIENALNEGSGNVVSAKLARAYSKGDPISGELEDAAKFAQSFDRATQEIKSSMPGISPLDVIPATTAAAATGNYSLLGLVSGRPLMRSLITSKPYQAMATTPKYPSHQGLLSIAENPAIPSLLGIGAPQLSLNSNSLLSQ